MRATISLPPYLVGTAAKPKLDGWLITLTIGSARPSIVKNDTEKVALNALRKSIGDYVAAGYTVEAKLHNKAGQLTQHATYATKRGQVERTDHKVPTAKAITPAAAAQERLDRPKPAKGKGAKKAPRRWTAKKAKALSELWAKRDPQGAGEFLDGFKRGEWSDTDCDKAERQLTPKKKKAAAADKAPKKAPRKAGENLDAAKKPGKKAKGAKRAPTAYQAFIGKEIKRQRAQGLDSKAAMAAAAAVWRNKKG